MFIIRLSNRACPRPRGKRRCLGMLAAVLLAASIAPAARAQGPVTAFQFGFGGAPGVWLDTDGQVRVREVDAKQELAAMRARLKAAQAAAKKDDKLVYLSLPRLFAQVRSQRQSGKPVPEDLRYLGGMTRLRYVFVFPEDRDLIVAGPAEPWRVLRAPGDATEFVVGARTGRPVMQLDDLISALRTAHEGQGQLFGCGIWPSPDSLKIADDIERRMARSTRAQRMKALAEGMGPQDVKIFGTRNDTRLAFICVAADYELKRFALGLEHAPVPGVGSGIDHTRTAVNKFWFEASYEPLLVSKEGDAFEVRGQRLAVRAGAFDFDPRGATETAKTFATRFTTKFRELAAAVPLFAELQNVADESLLANLIRRDHLAEKVGWDTAWLLDDAACPVATVPVPRTAQTLVGFTNGSLVAGGVILSVAPFIDAHARQPDQKQTLKSPAQELARLRKVPATQPSGDKAILTSAAGAHSS